MGFGFENFHCICHSIYERAEAIFAQHSNSTGIVAQPLGNLREHTKCQPTVGMRLTIFT
jgi:hypothetical protein